MNSKKKDPNISGKLFETMKEEAHLEMISLDDHGDTIVGNRLSAPNFDLEAKRTSFEKDQVKRRV